MSEEGGWWWRWGDKKKTIEKQIGDLEVWEEKCHSQTLVDFALKIIER